MTRLREALAVVGLTAFLVAMLGVVYLYLWLLS